MRLFHVATRVAVVSGWDGQRLGSRRVRFLASWTGSELGKKFGRNCVGGLFGCAVHFLGCVFYCFHCNASHRSVSYVVLLRALDSLVNCVHCRFPFYCSIRRGVDYLSDRFVLRLGFGTLRFRHEPAPRRKGEPVVLATGYWFSVWKIEGCSRVSTGL